MDARDAKRKRLSSALAHVPFNMFDRIRRLLDEDGEDQQAAAPAGFGWRSAQKVMKPCLGAYLPLYMPVEAPGKPSVCFWTAAVGRVLTYVMEKSDVFRAAFHSQCSANRHIEITLYADEATGGNVLQVASSKKVFLTYFSVRHAAILSHTRAGSSTCLWWFLSRAGGHVPLFEKSS